jgi:hypothetical protein
LRGRPRAAADAETRREGPAAAVGTMEAITTALDLSLDAALQVLATAIRVAAQLAVRFTWQFEITLVSQEAANVIEGRGLDKVDLLRLRSSPASPW